MEINLACKPGVISLKVSRLLHRGLGQLVELNRIDFVLTAIDIHRSIGDRTIASMTDRLYRQSQELPIHSIRPYVPFPNNLAKERSESSRIPSKVRAYLKLGATVWSMPYWDALNNSAKLLLALDPAKMPSWYTRRILLA